MQGTVPLKTEKLVLRKATMADAETLHEELGSNPEMTRYTSWNPYSTLEAAKEKVQDDIAGYEKEGCYAWIIEHAGTAVGTIGAYDYDPHLSSIEIGYSIFQKFWGKGYASEAASEVVRFLICEEGINRIHAWCHADNRASAAVLTRAGLRQEGVLRQAMKNPDGSYADQLIFGIVKNDYKK